MDLTELLLEKIRTLMIKSNLSRNMWVQNALTGVYLINRSLTKGLSDHVTPAQLCYSLKADISKLRVFGCKASSWMPDEQKKKKRN